MPLIIYYDNQINSLIKYLLKTIRLTRTAPLKLPNVIVPDWGIAQWMQHLEAQEQGISIGLKTQSIEQLWSLIFRLFDVPEYEQIASIQSYWTIFELLEALPHSSEFSWIRQRIGTQGSLEQLIFTHKLSESFSYYFAYRRNWLVRWTRGLWAEGQDPISPHEYSQRWIWNALLSSIDLKLHSWQHPYDTLIEKIRKRKDQEHIDTNQTHQLDSLWILGRIRLSSDQFSLLGALSSLIPVRIFAPDPCIEYWQDSPTRQSIKYFQTAENPFKNSTQPIEPTQNSLHNFLFPNAEDLSEEPCALSLWGKSHKIFIHQLEMLQEAVPTEINDSFREREYPPAQSVLQAIQQSVLFRKNIERNNKEIPDKSISLHSTHTAIRQAEVLHNQLLEALDRLESLQFDQIVVYFTDLKEILSSIPAVFNSVPENIRIPFFIQGKEDTSFTSALFEFLDLCSRKTDRITPKDFINWLKHPWVLSALSLANSDIEILYEWLEQAGAKYCLTNQNENTPVASSEQKHSLKQSINRLLLGLSLPEDAWHPVGNLVPIPAILSFNLPQSQHTVSALELLEKFLKVWSLTEEFLVSAQKSQPLSFWCQKTQLFLESAFGESSDTSQKYNQVIQVLSNFSELRSRMFPDSDEHLLVQLDTFAYALRQNLTNKTRSQKPSSSSVMFCPFGYRTAISYRVVCLLGMNSGRFPRTTNENELDLTKKNPKFGDASPRTDDQGWFLDAITSAQEQLIILYQGQNPKDSTYQKPSTLLLELIDVLSNCGIELPIIEHPLHPFSAENFTKRNNPNYHTHWLETSKIIAIHAGKKLPSIGPLKTSPTLLSQKEQNCLQKENLINEPLQTIPTSEYETNIYAGQQPQPKIKKTGNSVHYQNIYLYRSVLTNPAYYYLRRTHSIDLPGKKRNFSDQESLVPSISSIQHKKKIQFVADHGGQHEILNSLLASPDTGPGRIGTIQAQDIYEQGCLLSQTPPNIIQDRGKSLLCQEEPLSTISYRIEDTLLWMGYPKLNQENRPVLYSAFPLNMSSIAEAWLIMALWGTHIQERPVQVDLRTTESHYKFTCHNPESALKHAYSLVESICQTFIPLFPKTWLQYALTFGLPYSSKISDSAMKKSAIKKAMQTFSESPSVERYQALPESLRPEYLAIYRDSLPQIHEVIDAGNKIYGPILECIEIDKESGM